MHDLQPDPAGSPGRPLAWHRWLIPALLCLVLIALFIIGSRPPAPATGDSGPAPATTDLARKVILAGGGILLLLGALSFALILWVILRTEQAEEGEEEHFSEPNRLHWAIQLLLIVSPIALIAGIIYWIYTHRSPLPPATEAPLGGFPGGLPVQATPALVSGPDPGAGDYWLVLIGLVLLLLLVAAVVVITISRRRALSEIEPEAEAIPSDLLAAEVRDVVEFSLEDLAAETDPRRAVLAAYASLETVLARHAILRKPAETPQEFGTRITATGALPAEAMHGMTRLYDLARYSEQTIQPTMKSDAIAALVAIREAL